MRRLFRDPLLFFVLAVFVAISIAIAADVRAEGTNHATTAAPAPATIQTSAPQPTVKAIAAKVVLNVAIEQDGKVQSIQPIEVQVFEGQFHMTMQQIADEAIKQAREKSK